MFLEGIDMDNFTIQPKKLQSTIARENRNETSIYYSFSSNHQLYPEGYFHGMLVMERKRSERSENSFLLVLLDIENLIKKNPFMLNKKDEFVNEITIALAEFTRETDIKGWYLERRIIGIIFTEVENKYIEFLINKIKKNLKEKINYRQLEKIKISYYRFPEASSEVEKSETNIAHVLNNAMSDTKLINKTARVSKRIIDIIGSSFGILLLFPFFIVIPLLIKITSRGPVFFKQKRVGCYGKEYTMLKFRSMNIHNDSKIHQEFVSNYTKGLENVIDSRENITFKMPNDPRLSKLGIFLKRTSLDEIPLLINVLFGDMSLVGPRPALSFEVNEYDFWHQKEERWMEVRPGITGLWQFNRRDINIFDNMVRMDVEYIKEWSLLLDAKLSLNKLKEVILNWYYLLFARMSNKSLNQNL